MLLPLTSETLASLTKTEREVAQFINQNEDRLSQLSIVDIAYTTFPQNPQGGGLAPAGRPSPALRA